MKHSYIDDKVYFRHLMRIFTERFERLEGEEHKYGVQLMMLETHYVEIKQLLEDNSSSNKQIFDLMSKAFQVRVCLCLSLSVCQCLFCCLYSSVSVCLPTSFCCLCLPGKVMVT